MMLSNPIHHLHGVVGILPHGRAFLFPPFLDFITSFYASVFVSLFQKRKQKGHRQREQTVMGHAASDQPQLGQDDNLETISSSVK